MVDCSANVTSNLELYLDELSRVIFRKENLQSDRAWWLSAFYSLCIQNIVRELLVVIVRDFWDKYDKADTLAPKCYLHLAVKLFLASSGGYDPVMSNYNSAESIETTETNHFKLCQAAVKQFSWAGRGINSSRDYLCRVFGIDGTFNDEEPEPKENMANFIRSKHTVLNSSIPRAIARFSDPGTPKDGEDVDTDDLSISQDDSDELETEEIIWFREMIRRRRQEESGHLREHQNH
jgi:hypothetical protein